MTKIVPRANRPLSHVKNLSPNSSPNLSMGAFFQPYAHQKRSRLGRAELFLTQKPDASRVLFCMVVLIPPEVARYFTYISDLLCPASLHFPPFWVSLWWWSSYDLMLRRSGKASLDLWEERTGRRFCTTKRTNERRDQRKLDIAGNDMTRCYYLFSPGLYTFFFWNGNEREDDNCFLAYQTKKPERKEPRTNRNLERYTRTKTTATLL